MRHVQDDKEAGALGSARRRGAVLALGLAGLAAGAVLAGGGIASANHATDLLANATFLQGGGPPPPPPAPVQDEPEAPPPGAPADGQPAAPGAPAGNPGSTPPGGV